MLDEIEKRECFKILEYLSFDNLVSLTDTVTGKVVTVENKKEALEAIMLYTRTGEELLKRRKVRREHLYQYLAKQGYVEHPAADKATLLKKVVRLWEAIKQGKDGLDEKASFIIPHDMVKKERPDLTPPGPPEEVTAASTLELAQASSKAETAQAVTPEVVQGNELDEAQLLAVQFSAWFYQMLDSLTGGDLPSGTTSTNDDWGPQHFWPDSSLTIHCLEPDGEQELNITGAQEISEKFLSMRVIDKLHFNPNLSNNSVMGKQNPHGLTMVMTCGTVHKEQNFIGLFEQNFGLIRDPTEENNWKIKFSKLKLKAPGSSTPNNSLEAPS